MTHLFLENGSVGATTGVVDVLIVVVGAVGAMGTFSMREVRLLKSANMLEAT